jgi:hypothetical protein
MKQTIWLTTIAVASLLAVIGATPVNAGGWAITSLDPFDQPVSGRATTIGFTILQHGVTPVEVTDVAIRVSLPGEPGEFFPAVHDGVARIGHYTARVVFPSVGTYTWVVEQGWFGPQDLGQIEVAGVAPPPEGEAPQHPAALRYGLPAVAAMCLAFAVGQGPRDRRRLALR